MSEFTVRLPIVDAVKVEPDAHPARPARGDKIRIVLVEDNPDASVMLKLLLEQDGNEVHIARTGSEGIELIGRIYPEIALVDVGLPGMNGYEVALEVRKRHELNGVYLEALTGYGQTSDRQKAFDVGFDDHVTKPVDLLELRKVLHQFKTVTSED